MLNCEGEGFPVPDITWYRNGTVIDASEDDRVSITTTPVPLANSVSSMLVITMAMLEDSGEYHCTLSSSVSEYEDVMSGMTMVSVERKS